MVFWLILLCGFIRQCDGVTYQLSVLPEKVAIGQTLTIEARLIGPSEADTVLRLVLTQQGQQTISIFTYRPSFGCEFVLEPYISTGTVVICDPSNSRYIVRFLSVTAAHVGIYSLFAPLETPPRSNDVGLYINVELLVAPTNVVITPIRREAVEGWSTNFDCTVDDQATMPLTFIWKRIYDGNRVNLPAAATTSMLNEGRSNRLSWNSVSRKHAGQYECRASNEVGQLRSQPANLVVYYAATSVTLNLSTGTTTVSVGTSVTFTCSSTGGNPRPGLVISDAASGRLLGESVQLSSSVLTYGPVSMQKSANGAKYRCKTKAAVSVGSIPVKESNTLTLGVQFPPNDIKVSPRITVDEGQSTSVRCETTSSSNPMTELMWSGRDVGQIPESRSSQGAHGGVNTIRTITLTGDRTRNGATYTCTATHLGQRIYTKSTKLDVKFAPEAIAFYDTLDTPILENQVKVIRCRAETSKPAGTIVWRKMLTGIQSVIPADPPTEVPGEFGGKILDTEITIQPPRQDNGAKYWCEVEYIYTNGTKITRRSVATVLNVYYPVNLAIRVSQNTDSIREGDPITLTCKTSGGNPQMTDDYYWSHNGKILVDESERILSLSPIEYDQAGKYSCFATNKGGTSTSSVDINVQYKPKLDLTGAHLLEQGAAIGENVTFYLTILANPPPTKVEWTLADDRTLGPRFVPVTTGQVASLHIMDITAQDFTTYQCRVNNGVGATNFRVTLRSEGPPEIPSRFGISARSNSTVTVHWKSEFSGSENQTFLLELASASNEFALVSRVVDTGINSVIAQVVGNLQPDTEYAFRLRSKNNLGLFSSYTKTITEKTKPRIDVLKILISHFDETTVVVEWLATGKIFSAYSNATVYVKYAPVRAVSSDALQLGLSESFTAKFSDRKTVISVTAGVIYAYDVIVEDGGKVVFVLKKIRIGGDAEQGPPSFILPMVVALSAFLILLSATITVAVCYRNRKLRSQLRSDSRAPPVTTPTSTKNEPAVMFSAGTDNAAFEEENPYMIPVDSDPAYYHYSGNKYAVVGKPDVNDVTDYDYDVITGGVDEEAAIEDESGYMDMTLLNTEIQKENSTGGTSSSVPENEYMEMHSPVEIHGIS